jgi:hypothetical protein
MKTKRTSQETVDKLLEQASDTADLARIVCKTKLESINDPLADARRLVVYARDLIEASMVLMTQHEFQEMWCKSDEAQKEIERLKASGTEQP